jgi:hypothetical protein
MRTNPFAALAVLLIAALVVPESAAAQPIPPSFASLLPAGASLDASASEWAVIETSVTGGLRAEFPGTPRNCFRTESQLDIELKGESSLPLDMVRDLAQEDIEQGTSGLTNDARNRGSKTGTGSLDVVSVGEIRQEKLPNGLLVYYEYAEDCANRANAKVAVLNGHSRKGTTILSFHLAMNTGIADARAKAVEILDKFAKFDVEAAKRGK